MGISQSSPSAALGTYLPLCSRHSSHLVTQPQGRRPPVMQHYEGQSCEMGHHTDVFLCRAAKMSVLRRPSTLSP